MSEPGPTARGLAFATRPAVAPALVAAFALTLYLASLGGGYVLDDGPALLRHPAINGEAPWWEVFARAFWGQPLSGDEWSSSYRPLPSLMFALEHRITPAPWLHRSVSALTYAGACAMVTAFARRFMSPTVALIAGLAFAALPVHVENVAAIVGRADLLALIFGLGALMLALPRDGTASVRQASLASFAFLAALLSKESIALLPLVVGWLAALRWRCAKGDQLLGEALRSALLMGLAGIAYIVWRQSTLDVGLPPWFNPADNLLVERSGLARGVGVLSLVGHYAEITVASVRLCVDHTYGDIVPPASPFDRGGVYAWVGLAVLVLVICDGVAAWWGRTAGLGVAFGLAYLLVGNVVIDLSVIAADRLMLWPSVWLVLAVATGLERLELPTAARRRVAGLVGVLVLALAARSVHRSLDWRDEVTLQSSSLDACPAAVHGRFNLANELRRRGESADAVWHFAVAAAGRDAFPDHFEVPAFEAERELSVNERLYRLPALVEATDEARYYRGLHGYFMAQGWTAEADVVRQIVIAKGLAP